MTKNPKDWYCVRVARTRRDLDAANLIRALRVNRTGLSPEQICPHIRAKGVESGFTADRVTVSPAEIRLIERTGHIPGPRVKFALALYFGLQPGHIWKADSFALPDLERTAA